MYVKIPVELIKNKVITFLYVRDKTIKNYLSAIPMWIKSTVWTSLNQL
jgi:hypothetical protein